MDWMNSKIRFEMFSSPKLSFTNERAAFPSWFLLCSSARKVIMAWANASGVSAISTCLLCFTSMPRAHCDVVMIGFHNAMFSRSLIFIPLPDWMGIMQIPWDWMNSEAFTIYPWHCIRSSVYSLQNILLPAKWMFISLFNKGKTRAVSQSIPSRFGCQSIAPRK